MKKTILVLTAIERAFYSSTIEYQLIEPIIEVIKKRKDLRVMFVCLVPITFYFIRGDKKRSYSIFRSRRKRLKEDLEKKDISIYFLPTLFPLRHRSFYLRWFEIFIFLRFNFPNLFFFQTRFHPYFIHARGYPASLLAYVNNRLKKIRYIFDMRDVYQKKGVEGSVFRENDISYRFWTYLEQKIAKHADAIIVTSKPFLDYARGISYSDDKIWNIPNSVNMKRFSENKDIRKIVRKTLGIDDRFVLLHSGTFSTSGDVRLSIKYFKKWKRYRKESFFLILTPNSKNIDRFNKIFNEEGVEPKDYNIVSPEPEKVPDLLKAGDIGLHLEGQALATEYCIAIKDGEYLATGLPVICTPFLKGIAPLIDKYKCGIVVDPVREGDFSKEEFLLDSFDTIKKNTQKITREVLSLENAVLRLEKCYESVLGSN